MGELLPISALQHLLYCERQCALIHMEREWSENRFTAEGRVLHDRAHNGPSESRPGLRISRGITVVNHRLGLIGECDIVEFHRDGTILPVEYKRGKPKQHRADEVQLCAQALALEEMLHATIQEGHLFYGENRRRTVVPLDKELRQLTEATSVRLHELLSGTRLPASVYHSRLCTNCSLLNTCQPKASRSAANWFTTALATD